MVLLQMLIQHSNSLFLIFELDFIFGYILGFREMGFVEFHYWHVNMVFKLCSKFFYLIVFWLYFGVS